MTTVVPDADLLAKLEQLAGEIAAGAKGSNSAVKQLLLNTYGADVEGPMELEAGSSPQRHRRRRYGTAPPHSWASAPPTFSKRRAWLTCWSGGSESTRGY